MATPYATTHLASTRSTQDEARARFTGLPLLVTSARQTAGRGRHRRSWLPAPRAVAASLALELGWPPASWPRLTLVAGLAATAALDDACGLDWPNDLVMGDHKVGGLLAEVSDGVAVFGLGINLWWPEPPEGMAGVWDVDPGDEGAAIVAAAFASGLLSRIGSGSEEWGRDDYKARCVTLGEEVVWESGSGIAVDVADDGALVVETGAERLWLHSGDVVRIRRSTVPPMRPTE